jgi:hypothetical protein
MRLDGMVEIQLRELEKALYAKNSEIKRFTGSYDWKPAIDCPYKKVQTWRTECKNNHFQSATSLLRDKLSPRIA